MRVLNTRRTKFLVILNSNDNRSVAHNFIVINSVNYH